MELKCLLSYYFFKKFYFNSRSKFLIRDSACENFYIFIILFIGYITQYVNINLLSASYIGGKKTGKQGCGAISKSMVLIVVEDKSKHFGRIRPYCITETSVKSLAPAVQKVWRLAA
jgi:hypothetical protein